MELSEAYEDNMSDNYVDDSAKADWWKQGREEPSLVDTDEWMLGSFKQSGIEGTEMLIRKEKDLDRRARLIKQYKRLVIDGLWGIK